jgi:hypothetical protein
MGMQAFVSHESSNAQGALKTVLRFSTAAQADKVGLALKAADAIGGQGVFDKAHFALLFRNGGVGHHSALS